MTYYEVSLGYGSKKYAFDKIRNAIKFVEYMLEQQTLDYVNMEDTEDHRKKIVPAHEAITISISNNKVVEDNDESCD